MARGVLPSQSGIIVEWENFIAALNRFEARARELRQTREIFDPAFHRYRHITEIALLNQFGDAVTKQLGKQT